MSFLDSILNLVGLVLWIDWRSSKAVVKNPPQGVTLAHSLQSTERQKTRPWISLGALVLLLGVRGFFYWNVGTAATWTPVLDLVAISLSWRSDLLPVTMLFSVVSFGLTLFAYISGLLLLSCLHSRRGDEHQGERFVRFQLGWLDRLPWPFKLVLPFLIALGLWTGFNPLLAHLQMVPEPQSLAEIIREGAVLGLCIFIYWEWLLLPLFLLHFINTYVYLGHHPFWEYVSRTGGRLLWPLKFLRIGRLDLSPLAGMALVIWMFEYGLIPLIRELYQRYVQ